MKPRTIGYEAPKKGSGKLWGQFSDLQIEYGKKQDTIAELADNASVLKTQLHNCDCRLSEVYIVYCVLF